jgi:hypothetical protein
VASDCGTKQDLYEYDSHTEFHTRENTGE